MSKYESRLVTPAAVLWVTGTLVALGGIAAWVIQYQRTTTIQRFRQVVAEEDVRGPEMAAIIDGLRARGWFQSALRDLLLEEETWRIATLLVEQPTRIVPELVDLLSSGDERTRLAAARGLAVMAFFGEDISAAGPRLAEMIADEPSTEIRSYAIAAYGQARLGTIVPQSVLDDLDNTDPWARLEAARFVGRIQPSMGSSALCVLIELLDSSDAGVAGNAAHAISDFGEEGQAAAERLQEAVRTREKSVAGPCITALGAIGDDSPETIALLRDKARAG